MALIREIPIRNIKLKKSEAEIRKTARILAQARRIGSGPAFFKDSPEDLLAKIAGHRGDRDVHSELDSYQIGLQYLERP